MNDSVTVHMAATPEHVWDLVSDITNTGKFSPETFEAEWLGGANGPAVGNRFRGHVKRNGRGPTYWTTCVVETCEPGREFSFAVVMRNKPTITWKYECAPADGGVDVTESFQLPPTRGSRIYWALAGRARGKTNREGMATTLNRIKAVAEAAPSDPTS